MSHYLRVFNFLWRAKRMEYILTDIRKGHMCNAKLLRNMPGKPAPGGRRTRRDSQCRPRAEKWRVRAWGRAACGTAVALRTWEENRVPLGCPDPRSLRAPCLHSSVHVGVY